MPQYAPYGNAIYGITAYGSPPAVSVQTTMSVSPIPTSGTPSIGLYDSLFINWTLPGGNWNQMILVRSSFAVPSSPFGNDGIQLVNQTSGFNTSFTDTGLQTGRFYYYALYVYDTDVSQWLMAASAQGLCLTDYGFENLFTAWTPDWYMEQDQLLTPASPLARFFGLIGFEMNWVRSEVETLFTLNNPEYISGAMLPYLGANVGINYEPALGMGVSRNLVSQAVSLYKTKGTSLGVQGAAAAYSGYGTTLTLGPNLEIQLDDATADRSVGHWSVQNPNTTLSQVSASTYNVTPQHSSYLAIQGNTGLSSGLLTANGVTGYMPPNNQDMFLLSAANTFQWTQQPQAAALPGAAAASALVNEAIPGPTTLVQYAMAYYPANNTTVLFGGSVTASATQIGSTGGAAYGTNQTWIFNGTYWTQANPAVSPPARSCHSMAYDPVSGNLIMFGGISPIGAYLNDTWSWNGTTWTQINLTSSNMLTNTQGKSGLTGFGNGSGQGDPWGLVNPQSIINAVSTGQVGTWPAGTSGGFSVTPWNWSGPFWRFYMEGPQVAITPNGTYSASVFCQFPVGDTGPNSAFEVGINWYSATGQPLGRSYGNTVSNTQAGVWQQSTLSGVVPLNGGQVAGQYATYGQWFIQGAADPGGGATPVLVGAPYFATGSSPYYTSGVNPGGRYGHAMASWSGTARVGPVLFGGTGQFTQYLNDTWTWTGGTWVQQLPVHSPSARYFHAMAYNSFEQATPNLANGVAVLFGGNNATAPVNGLADTWLWNGMDWATPAVTSAPPARYGHAMAYNIATDQIVIHGGVGINGSYGDVWVWSAPVAGTGTWKQYNGAPVIPGNRWAHGMAYTPLGTLVTYGGVPLGANSNINDTWIMNTATDVWWQLDGTQTPLPRVGAAICYNAATTTVQMFGGGITGGITNVLPSFPYTVGTFWQWSAAAGWQVILPANGVMPSARWASQMVYTVGGQVLLYGGTGPTGVLGDVWIWNGTAWSQKTSSGPAGARFGHHMVWDPAVGKVIIYGGSTSPIDPNLSDTWSYTVATNAFAALAAGPPARALGGMVNTTNGASILYGGFLQTGVPDNRTWVYQSTGANANTWTPLTPTGTPPARFGHSMVYDTVTSQVVMMFGWAGTPSAPATQAPFTDTWQYAVTNNNWTQNGTWTSPAFTSTTTPATTPRFGMSAVYSPAANAIVAIGGSTGLRVGSLMPLGDTYTGSPGAGQVYISECSPANATTLGIPVVLHSNSYMVSNINPLAWWKLNETVVGSPIFDYGSIGNSGGTGSLIGTGTLIGQTGAVPVDTAYTFNGNSYISIPESEFLEFGNNQSFSFGGWFKTTSSAIGLGIIYKGNPNPGGGGGWSAFVSQGFVGAQVGDNTNIFSAQTTGAATGTWQFLTATVDRTANLLILYINGTPRVTTSIVGLGSVTNTFQSTTIGAGPGGITKFIGSLQEVFAAQGALSGAQVASLYSSMLSQTAQPTYNQYVLSGYFQPVPSSLNQATPTVESFFAQLDWYSSNGSLISSSIGSSVQEIVGQWVRAYVVGTPPSGAAYIGRTFKSVSTTMIGDQHLFDAVQLEFNTQATPGPTSWTPPRDLRLNLFPYARNLVINGQGILSTTGFDTGGTGVGGGTASVIAAVTTGPLPTSGPTWPAQVSAGFSVTTFLNAGTNFWNINSALNATAALPVNPGQAYSASAWVIFPATYNLNNSAQVNIVWYGTTNANSYISTTAGSTVGGVAIGQANGNWIQCLALDAIAPAGAHYAQIVVTGTFNGASTVYVAGPSFGPGLNVTYFDGLFSPSPDYAFEGTPNLSPTAWYPNVLTRLDRLIEVMPKYTPIGSTFSIYTHANAWANVGLH